MPPVHKPMMAVGSLPSHWTQANNNNANAAAAPVKPAGGPPIPPMTGANQPQRQMSGSVGGPPVPPSFPLNSNNVNAINNAADSTSNGATRPNSRWGAPGGGGGVQQQQVQQQQQQQQDPNIPIGRPIPVVGSDREGAGPSTPWQQAAAKGAQPPAEGDCIPGFIDPALPKEFMKILTRTVYVGGITPTITKEEVRDLFETIARVDTVTVNYPKFNAFVKLLTRAEADLIKERFHKYQWNGTMLKMGWGCGYGPKEFFDYGTGETLFPVARMTDVEKRTISQSPRGGGVIEGGMVVEEPDFGWPQKGDIVKGKYASGQIVHAPGYLAAIAQRDRGGFNNNVGAATATAVGSGAGMGRGAGGYMAQGGMGIGGMGGMGMGMGMGGMGMPPRPPAAGYAGMAQARMPYRNSVGGGGGGGGGIVVVSDRQYDDRDDHSGMGGHMQRGSGGWPRPKPQHQDRGEEHVVVLGGGGGDSDEETTNPKEETAAAPGSARDDGHRGYDSPSAYHNGGGGAGRMGLPPGQQSQHFGYPNPMMYAGGAYGMRPPPPHWGMQQGQRGPMMMPPQGYPPMGGPPMPYHGGGGGPRSPWGPAGPMGGPMSSMGGEYANQRKRPHSPDGPPHHQHHTDDDRANDDRGDGGEGDDGKRARAR
ncbi:hypothetical protein HDU86_008461 [Geranomyces michiganensis]|nr:hypothetical protein HDU86_008461 [Geranomyces michiganensis]